MSSLSSVLTILHSRFGSLHGLDNSPFFNKIKFKNDVFKIENEVFCWQDIQIQWKHSYKNIVSCNKNIDDDTLGQMVNECLKSLDEDCGKNTIPCTKIPI